MSDRPVAIMVDQPDWHARRLVEAFAADESDVRWRAARLVVETGRLHAEVLPLVSGLLDADPAPRVRTGADWGDRLGA